MLSPKCASTASYQSLSAYLGFNIRKLDGLKYAQASYRNQIPTLQKNHKKNNQVHAKHNVVASESLHATKKMKHMDARDDLASGHIPKDVKTVFPCSTFVEDKSSKMLELKRSTLN